MYRFCPTVNTKEKKSNCSLPSNSRQGSRGENIYVVVLIEIKPEQFVEVPMEVAKVLDLIPCLRHC